MWPVYGRNCTNVPFVIEFFSSFYAETEYFSWAAKLGEESISRSSEFDMCKWFLNDIKRFSNLSHLPEYSMCWTIYSIQVKINSQIGWFGKSKCSDIIHEKLKFNEVYQRETETNSNFAVAIDFSYYEWNLEFKSLKSKVLQESW